MFYQIGPIKPPRQIINFPDVTEGGFGVLIELLLGILIMAGGIYALFNFIMAGYAFFSAGDDPKKVQGAWSKIYQTIIGLLFIFGSLLLTAVISQLITGDPFTLIRPSIPTVNEL